MADTRAGDGTPPLPSKPDDINDNEITLTVYHRGQDYIFTLPPTSTLQDLSASISDRLSIPSTNQKFLISPKPGMQKHPFQPTPINSLPTSAPRFKITLFGSTAAEVNSVNAAAPPPQRTPVLKPVKPTPRRAASTPTQYTFHKLLPLAHLPNPERSLAYLARLRDDPGIRAAMKKHKFSVPLLTEMNPVEWTTHDSRTLGLNRNKGEVIELRLRTDAYDGYRDYRTIRKTLCHELAHCVFGEHDRDFWDLMGIIEKEVERGDYWGTGRGGGKRLGEEEFYNPGDWEEMKGGGMEMDHGGWTGGEFVLGGRGGGRDLEGVSRREILAEAAERRFKMARQEKGQESEGGKEEGA
ncbi:hypothetical protein AJ79_01287 [Helicocarpus griseus UAMH5409]|uniref:WLM domain-containing protein n=1 Tax=Helicocarpus griseus UAMH5409 TaxID=1447875 RepID=A0A2B7Y7S2_9EURO|nr:hypothetical protein AJ79_01287 [Helicocarpus griseus UAMH5409]